ncbi:lipoprotein N-acyltransferase Lnb domain-containing protein [Polaribacter sp.]|uniref:lipoprotein N-acyltransferase Lnb domain-containing protein n=1 Tax=Polaribacter sp. TaxID=1920175 RepID=UPI003F6C7C61
MKKSIFLLLLFTFLGIQLQKAQVNLSVYSEISIVTAGPGDELYEKFGHSAIRIKDPVLNLDIIYNYGIFDFNAPNFYTNFAQGKMYYLLAKYDFKYFLNSYKRDRRWVKQQVLNLNQQEKQAYFGYLETNALKENATYLYDPFFNNCATKLRDITKDVFKNKVIFETEGIKENKSLRSLMNQELYYNSWGNLGINLIAGTILDVKRKPEAHMYLPDFVYSLFKNASVKSNDKEKQLVLREDVILNFEEKRNSEFSLFSPLIILTFITLIVIFITYKDYEKNSRTKIVDFLVFFITGFVGLILVYLWLFSSHKTAPNNFNILWAFLPNLILAFLVSKSILKTWFKRYLMLLLLFLLVIPVFWVFKIQVFPIAIIPLLLLLFVRYIFLYKYLLSSKK